MNYTHNPRLRARFFERMDAYQCLWSGISFMSQQYVQQAEEVAEISYRFLSDPEGVVRGSPLVKTALAGKTDLEVLTASEFKSSPSLEE